MSTTIVFEKLCRIADKYGYDKKKFIEDVLRAYQNTHDPKCAERKENSNG